MAEIKVIDMQKRQTEGRTNEELVNKEGLKVTIDNDLAVSGGGIVTKANGNKAVVIQPIVCPENATDPINPEEPSVEVKEAAAAADDAVIKRVGELLTASQGSTSEVFKAKPVLIATTCQFNNEQKLQR